MIHPSGIVVAYQYWREAVGSQGLADGDKITENMVEIKVIIDATDGIKSWVLEYGQGVDPGKWKLVADGKTAMSTPNTIASWDVSEVSGDTVTLRLYVTGENGYAEKKINLSLDLPMPTPTPTSTPTATSPPTPTGTPTPTYTPTTILLPSNTCLIKII